MMNKVLIGLIGAAGAMLVASCADTFNPGGDSDRQGRIFPQVDLDNSVVTSKSAKKAPASRAADAVTADQMKIRLVRNAGGYDKTWESLAEFPANETYPVGAYTFSASYGSAEEQGYGKPYYYGESEITVEENRTSQVQVVAQLANSMLTITYTDAFKAYFSDYKTTLTTTLGDIVYDQEAPVYLPEGEVAFAIEVTKPTGSKVTLNPGGITTKARHHYFVEFDLNNGNVESPVLNITWDELLNIEPVIIDLSDDLINAPAPTMTSEGFPVESFIAGNAPEGNRTVTVVAHGGISSIVMTTTSASLLAQGWPSEMDLLANDAAANAATAALGLSARGVSKAGEKFALVNLTNVLNNIKYVEGADNKTEFTFVAKDKYNKTSEPMTVSVEIEKLVIELSNPSAIVKGQTDFSCNLAYNGGNPEQTVTMQVMNDRGTWSPIDAKFTAVSRTVGNYLVEVTVDADRDTKLRAVTADGSVSAELPVVHAEAPHALSIDDRNSFAHSTKVTLIDNPNYAGAAAAASRRIRKSPADWAANATLQISTDGKFFSNAANAALNGTTWTVTGLDANKTYYFRAIVDGLPCQPATANTEEELGIANSNLDGAWTTSASGKYWTLVHPASPWETINAKTTSSRNGTDGTTYSYVAISGTIETGDAHSGKAALIRTVGYGSGSAATGTASAAKHIAAGELYLGQYNTDTASPEYGIPFASRPAKISFWYKYAKKASEDYGYAEVTIYDAENNAIYTETKQLTASSYTNEVFSLNYPDFCAKAAKISIVFKSSGHTDLESKKNNTWITPPKFGNLSTGTFLGSQLYIDDIELAY